MGSHNLERFWQSIISEKGIIDQLTPIMSIEDSKERTLKLLCQTLFLLVMEIKGERDNPQSRGFDAKREEICRSCQERISGNREEMERSSEESPIHDKEKLFKVDKKTNKKYRSLSRSSPSKKGFSSRKVNDEHKLKGHTTEDFTNPAVIVPETLSLDENPLHVDVEKRKLLSTQTVMVPETMAMDYTIKEEDADFFDSSNVSKENVSPEKCKLNEETSKELNSPIKNDYLELSGEQSPILGKVSKPSLPRIRDNNEGLDIPKKLDFENAPLVLCEPPDPVVTEKNISKPDLQITSTPRYSPLVFTHSPSILHDESDMTSPSLLPGAQSKNSESDKGSPLLATLGKNPQFPASSKAKKSLQKAASSFNVSPKEKGRRLQRHHSLGKQPRQSYVISLEPPDQQNKKIFKQTKISAEVFQQKQKTAKMLKDEEDERLRAAMMESLRSKEVEDMMRKKEQALQMLELEDPLTDAEKKTGGPSLQEPGEVAKVSHSPRKEKTKKLHSPIKLPKLSPTKYITSPEKLFKSPPKPAYSPRKKLRQTFNNVSSSPRLRSSPRKEALCSSRNLSKTSQKERSSPRKRQPLSPEKTNWSPPKKRKVEENRVLEIDQLLQEVNASPGVAQVQVDKSQENSTGQRKMTLRKNKRQFFDNSFDIIPAKNVEPNYAYQGEVVRKKDARKNLEGWGCRQCEEWYENQDLNPEEKKKLMNKCSRHRSKHNPITNTPKNFWDPGWVDSEDP